MSVGRWQSPPPPVDLSASPDVETLWFRYEMYRQDKEPLASMAYFCLTVIEALAGGSRRRAAKTLVVDFSILDTLGRLVSQKGDAKTARKYSPSSESLHPHEATWIDEVMRP